MCTRGNSLRAPKKGRPFPAAKVLTAPPSRSPAWRTSPSTFRALRLETASCQSPTPPAGRNVEQIDHIGVVHRGEQQGWAECECCQRHRALETARSMGPQTVRGHLRWLHQRRSGDPAREGSRNCHSAAGAARAQTVPRPRLTQPVDHQQPPLALEVLFASAPTAAPAAMFLEIVPVSCSTIWVTAAAPPSPTPALIWNATCCKSSQSDSAEHRGVCFIEKDWMEAAASPGDNLVTSSISSNSVPRCMNRMVFASAVGMLRKSQLGRCGHWTEE